VTPTVLNTARLQLRPLCEDDADALFAAFNDSEAMHFWSRAPFETVGELRAWFAPNPDWPAWAIIAGGVAIGRAVMGLKRSGVAEIGYLIAPAHWRKGYTREAVSALIDHGFGTLGLRRIFADVDPENAPSIRLLRRLGFREEGHLRAEWETHLGVRDSLIFGMLAGEWNS
jgi:[ribosomal protein S5]-alanine N-acetyltransferase